MLAALARSEIPPAERLDTLPPWPWPLIDHRGRLLRSDAPPTLGWHAIAWVEGWPGFPTFYAEPDGFAGLIQPSGPRRRLPVRLTRRQRRFLLWFYALDRTTRRFVFRYAVRRLAKGSGKSPFAAILCLLELVGPVRLEAFDDSQPGGVIARSADMAWVQIAATSEAQTKNTMRMVRAYAPRRSPIVEHYGLDPGLTRYYGDGERQLEVITSSETTAEGAETSFVVADEQEHWTPPAGPALSETLADNLAKSGARMLGTANAWRPGAMSVAETDWDAWVAEESGLTRGDARTLYDAVVVPEDLDPSDVDQLRAALQIVYDDCDWKRPHDEHGEPIESEPVDIEAIVDRWLDLRARPAESLRKYGNRPKRDEEHWLQSLSSWLDLADRDRYVEPGEQIALGFDGSLSDDATALIGCVLDDGFVFSLGIWQPDPKVADDQVDADLVDAAVDAAFDRYNVAAFLADVREWESYTKVEWPNRYGDQLRVQAAPSARRPQAIAWDMRTRLYDFTTEAELVHDEIVAGGFRHDGDPVLALHVGNARNRPNRYGMGIGKESPGSPRKIDGCVSMIIARHARRLALAAPAPKAPGQGGGWT